jgi:putative transposase
MARKLRIEFEGAIHHLTVRGVERRTIFRDEQDHERFLRCLGEGVKQFGIRLYLFCLMDNHVHLLVETPQANLSAFMHRVQTAYTVYFNLRHRRAGHLMQGRFGGVLVDGGEYLLKLSRYIHLNPVFVGGVRTASLEERVNALRAYRWSSYRGYAGIAQPYPFVEEGPVLAMLEGADRRRRRTYREYVEAGIAQTDEELCALLKTSRWGVGEQDFQDRIRDLHADVAGRVRRREDVSFRRAEGVVGAEDVLKAVAGAFGTDVAALKRRQYRSLARAAAAFLLGRHAGMNQRDIGAFLAMGSGSAVCQQLQRLREHMKTDSDLRSTMECAHDGLKLPVATAQDKPTLNS